MQLYTDMTSEEKKRAKEWVDIYKEEGTQEIKNKTGAEKQNKKR